MTYLAAFVGAYLASLMDPIALALCSAAGTATKRLAIAMIAGASVYLFLALFIGPAQPGALIAVRALAGVTIGTLGWLARRWLTRKNRSTAQP